MKVLVAAVGRAGKCPESDLVERYAKRLRWPLRIVEVEERKPVRGAQRKKSEADKLLAAIPGDACVVAMDEKGRSLGSEELATFLENKRSQGVNTLAFILGGADGLDDRIRERADMILSLGAMTWPHLLARAMLVEQVYRAATILEGHPYHRS